MEVIEKNTEIQQMMIARTALDANRP
jgi:hypothetical protein